MDLIKLGKDAAKTLAILMEHSEPQSNDDCQQVIRCMLLTCIASIAANTNVDNAVEQTVEALKEALEAMGAHVDIDLRRGMP